MEGCGPHFDGQALGSDLYRCSSGDVREQMKRRSLVKGDKVTFIKVDNKDLS